ncbi:MAG: hypothetical protein ACR2Q4_07070 [Geminicoccaceae bacterium]
MPAMMVGENGWLDAVDDQVQGSGENGGDDMESDVADAFDGDIDIYPGNFGEDLTNNVNMGDGLF